MTKRRVVKLSRWEVYRLAGEAALDPRTIRRAVERGIDTMKAAYDRAQLRAAAAKLGIVIE